MTSRQFEPFTHQRLGRVDVGHQTFAQGVVLNLFEAQPQTRQRRLQIMADGREQLGAFLEASSDAGLHDVEGR